MSMKMLHLSADGCSMRAVKLRQLSPTEVDQCAEFAGLKQGMTLIAYQNEYQRLGCIRMLVEYSAPFSPGAPKADKHGKMVPSEVDWSKVTWIAADPTQMEISFGNGSIFNAKDVSILAKVFTRWHESNGSEVEAILGKAQTVHP